MNNELSKRKNDEIEVTSQSPAEMIKLAVSGGADLDKLEKLLTLQERWEANEAKKAYHQAMAAFKANPPKITKDKKNNQYNSMYTTLGNLVNTVNPELSKHGLSASWDIKQNGIVSVTCRITHKHGHSECSTAAAPADVSGAKNAIQQIKSTITYLKAVTFEAITGLASSDANVDDDGNGAGDSPITEEQEAQLREWILSKKVDEQKFLKYLKVESMDQISSKMFPRALAALKAKK